MNRKDDRSRRFRAREVALQLLFQHDVNAKPLPQVVVKQFVADRLLQDDLAMDFCKEVFRGVNEHRIAIDELIVKTAENWRLHRINPVDRNILRLGTYEILFATVKTPLEVAINESIELARRFGTADSPAFVNGILDKIAKTPDEPPPTPVPATIAEVPPPAVPVIAVEPPPLPATEVVA